MSRSRLASNSATVCMLSLALLSGVASAQDQWTLASSKASPGGRKGAAMAYDSARQVVVLYGGYRSTGSSSGPTDETWEWDGVNWTKMAPLRRPKARADHAMVYDSHRKVCVMYGGAYRTGTWEWDGKSWVERHRGGVNDWVRQPAMAYDQARRQVVRFGGTTGKPIAETWTFDGKTWTQVKVPGPPAREEHAIAYDPLRERIVLFGGLLSTNVTVGDTWEWDGKSWREIKSKTLPPIRRRHALAWMGSAGKVMLHGGVVHNTALKTGETWAWNGVDWHKRHLQGNPGQKEWIGLVYDERRQQLVLYGGGSGGYKWDETWLYTSKPAVPAKFTAYGSGCKGTVGVPSLTLEGQHLPFIGEVLQMRLSPLPKAAFNVPLGILGGSRTQWGAAKLPLSMTPFGLAGCSLYVSYDIPILLTNQGGTALWKQPLPYEPSLIGNRFYAQALVLDIGANKANLIMSNAAELLLGDR